MVMVRSHCSLRRSWISSTLARMTARGKISRPDYGLSFDLRQISSDQFVHPATRSVQSERSETDRETERGRILLASALLSASERIFSKRCWSSTLWASAFRFSDVRATFAQFPLLRCSSAYCWALKPFLCSQWSRRAAEGIRSKLLAKKQHHWRWWVIWGIG